MKMKLSRPLRLLLIIAEVFKNYISNDIRHAFESKRIIFQAEKSEDSIVVGVGDFGKSIPVKDYRDIFKQRTKLEPGANCGRGLGLAIVRRIAGAYNGKVWVTPNKLTGNIFYFKLSRVETVANLRQPVDQ